MHGFTNIKVQELSQNMGKQQLYYDARIHEQQGSRTFSKYGKTTIKKPPDQK